jgi:ABC-type antimicrobial peptide transport system permease subunit
MFVHVNGNPYALVTPVTRIIREFSADQIVERAATLEDIRAEVLTPDRLNTVVFGSFAAVALLIALVGVAGVLAFSVSGRIREFGIRLAIGSQQSNILNSVIRQGLTIAGAGVLVGAVGGYAVARLAGSWFQQVQMPGAVVVVASAAILLVAALVASVVPASRAARVDVMEALRAE